MAAEYKRFIASTFEEARQKMFREMGPNAYIIEKRQFTKKSFLGLKKENFVELRGGVLTDTEFQDSYPRRKAAAAKPAPLDETLRIKGAQPGPAFAREDRLAELHRVISQKKAGTIRKPEPVQAPLSVRPILSFADDMPATLPADLYGTRREENTFASAPPVSVPAPRSRKKETIHRSDDEESDRSGHPVAEFLKRYDYSGALVDKMVSETHLQKVETEEEKLALATQIAAAFEYTDGIRIYATNANVIFFIGPTGVGKTTTLTKVATKYAVIEKKQCLLATFDLRRIMAAAQLERYAHIMEIPFRTVGMVKELRQLITEHIGYQLIFMDTYGTNYSEEKNLNELFDFVNFIDIPREVHLCMSASMRLRDMERILKGFYTARYDRILITKVDESHSLGTALSAIFKTEVPISYITTGQEVPKDIVLASEKTVVAQLLKEWRA